MIFWALKIALSLALSFIDPYFLAGSKTYEKINLNIMAKEC